MHAGPYISAVALTRPIQQDRYLLKIPAVRYLLEQGPLVLSRPVTFLVGENGTGKSTLLEAIAAAYGFNPEGGTKNFRFSTAQSHSELWKCLTLTKRGWASDGFFLRAESFFNAATYIDQADDEPSFAPPLIDSYGVYLLDEPEAALSPMRQMTLLAEMDALVKDSSQFIISTHSPILMTFPGAEILQLDCHGITSVPYQDTEHYQITRRFLENPERMLRYLLER